MGSMWIINGDDYGKWRGRGNPEKFIDRREITLIGDNKSCKTVIKKALEELCNWGY